MKRTPIMLASVTGFMVPVVCGAIDMFFFSAKDSPMVHFLCFQLPNIVCPVWALGDGSGFWVVAIPFLNALTYGAIAFVWLKVKQLS
jgi:hypothetical protein